MELAAIFHRPESEDAFLHTDGRFYIRLRTKKADVLKAYLLGGDPYLFDTEKWWQQQRPMTKIAETLTHDYWEISVEPPFSRWQYGFVLENNDETIFYGDRGCFPVSERVLTYSNYYFRMPFLHEQDAFKAPEWASDTRWYQIFPERFANGQPELSPANVKEWSQESPTTSAFYGGDLQGIINHLDYLEELGINGLYFTPIFKAPTNHKYDTEDYFTIDSHFGNDETFQLLVDEAHRRGMRIMLDAVFNHIGDLSPQWQDVVKNEEKSKYKDWFHVHSFPVREGENGNIENETTLSFDTFSFTIHMPKLNTANPEVQDYLISIATYWVEKFGIDAWRLDVANEVDHQFWKKLNAALTAVRPDIYILGEIWHSAQRWLEGDEFHTTMNYPYIETINDYFIDRSINEETLISGLNTQLMMYRKATTSVMFNMLDSHDTARVLSRMDNDTQRLKQLLAFVFTQKGTPCIYYGTEVGLDGFNDPDCRKCMIWDETKQDQDLLTFTKSLMAFRKEYNHTIQEGELQWLPSTSESITFSLRENETTLYCIFNRATMEQDIAVPTLPKSAQPIFGSGERHGQKIRIKTNDFIIFKDQ
ncbi:glycoside hydrolase family 13 protein [Brochothrix thermosphacta]|uniref:glycoside hydrolase family 13 protein n=1 Tax=Brochothrix thermosphacta TaxID=2756 RepID=UPI0039AF1FC6